MKAKVKDIKPNPFRDMSRYPINPEKVDNLVASFANTSFWPTLVGRKNRKGEIEIAFGHHRLMALRKAGIEEIDITIRNYSDHEMLKMMADENLEAWATNMNVIRETVRAAKQELERDPEVYNKYYKPMGKG
jgi:ParB/RepB/Spo0J family partition protein